MNGFPVFLSGSRICILSAQEAEIIGRDHRVYARRIAIELSVIHLDAADILLAALHGLDLTVALNLLGNFGRSDRHRND